MKTKKYIIQINQPCDQDWHKMTNCEQGRFCSQCSKTVHDFSQYSDKQIIEFLTKQKGNVCGRMKETQLNQVISNSWNNSSHHWKYYLSSKYSIRRN